MIGCDRCQYLGEPCPDCRRTARLTVPRPPARRTRWDDAIDARPAGPTWPEPF